MLFVFFLIVFIVFLAWGYIIRTIRRFYRANKVKSEREEIHYRQETGRQRQQYSQRQQASGGNSQASNGTYSSSNGHYSSSNGSQQAGSSQQGQARRTQTVSGETIIDHRHQERENNKIFNDSDGEYVEFTEE